MNGGGCAPNEVASGELPPARATQAPHWLPLCDVTDDVRIVGGAHVCTGPPGSEHMTIHEQELGHT